MQNFKLYNIEQKCIESVKYGNKYFLIEKCPSRVLDLMLTCALYEHYSVHFLWVKYESTIIKDSIKKWELYNCCTIWNAKDS